MAERKVTTGSNFLFIDPLGGTSFSLMICLEKFDLKVSRNVIDAATMCGPDLQAGPETSSITFNGQQMLSPGASRTSNGDLLDLLQAKTTISWKIATATPVTGDEVLTGTGFISDLSNGYDFKTPSSFSGTISVKSTITKVVTP